MNEFVQMEELTSGMNVRKKHSKPSRPSKLRDHYNQLESSLSSKIEDISQQQQAVGQLPIQQVQKPATKFKLALPATIEPDAPQERNMPVKNKRVLVEPAPASTLKQSKTAGQLKIYDLQEDIQEDVAENTQYSIGVKPEKFLAFQQEQVPQLVKIQEKEIVQEKSSSLLHIQQQTKWAQPSNKPKQPVDNPPAQSNLFSEQYQKSRLFSKITQKDAPITKGIFVEKKNSIDDYEYIFPDTSKQSMDSGLQVTSLYSSRDELSTRNILLPSLQKSSSSKRYKLPELKPYKEVLESKLQEIPSQTLLKDEPEKQAPSPKKKVKMTRDRQVVIKSSYIANVSDFVKNPVPYGKRLECTLTRNKACCIGCYLDYDLRTTDGKYLISCKKMPYCLNSTYNISTQSGMFEEKSGPFLGKVKGNFTGSIFNIYTYIADSLEQFQVSATIFYSSEFFCNREKTREVQIFLKNKNCRYYDLAGTEIQKGRTLKDLYEIEENRGSKRISKFVTKQPVWNARLEMFTLNFHKKAKHASVKNAIFVRQGKPQSELLMIAKQGQNQFAVEISYPFSPMVALGVIITGFDFKLASQ